MKKLVIIMLAMLSMQGIAQEVEIQQTINEKINSLYIGRGWDVRFIQPRDSLSDKELKNIPTTISIIVPEELASKAQSVTPIEYETGYGAIWRNVFAKTFSSCKHEILLIIEFIYI